MKVVPLFELYRNIEPGKEYILGGWVRNTRETKSILFINLSDGTYHKGIQVVMEKDKFDREIISRIWVGSSMIVKGVIVESPGKEQPIELNAREILFFGEADKEKYPLQPKWHSLEFMRENAHLRFRTNLFSAVFRLRSYVSYHIHKFFQDRGFVYLHTPIITPSDCEGAGTLFTVTTLENPNGNYENDFFGRRAYLTVSGQLEAEAGACALSRVYTFGPTFRAEPSHTTRHLSEFWMIEPEVAFYELEDIMSLAEEFIKYLTSKVLEEKIEEINIIHDILKRNTGFDASHRLKMIERVCQEPFERISYTTAVEILKASEPYRNRQFKYLIEWGDDLQTEHERYLTEQYFKKPVIVYDYPFQVKAFYMKRNDDGRTVRAMDILVPIVGEIIGGSQREENYDKLKENIKLKNMKEDILWWYLDLRRFGTVPHSGFGLGLERYLSFITGLDNVKDVIPFPRVPGYLEF